MRAWFGFGASMPVAVGCVAIGCGGVVSASDASPTDEGTSDGIDGIDTSDASLVDYHDLGDGRFWSSVDLNSLVSQDLALTRACFDGRYVYWGAQGQNSPAVVRYDTLGSFQDLSSWSSWSLNQYESASLMFFDGRYIYLGQTTTRAMRFDTQGSFGDRSALSFSATIFGANGVLPNTLGLGPGAFDGRYIYFQSEQGVSPPYHPITIRFDPLAGFESRAAWSAFDPQLGDMVPAVWPAVFAPPYLVRTPTFPPSSTSLLYDTRLPFNDGASWSKFPVKGVTGDEAFVGAGTDGRYAYFVPYRNAQGSSDGLVARYDTTAPLMNAASWQTFDMSQVHPYAKGMHAASWDGRYFYFMVGSDSMQFPSNGEIVTRYDTTRDFRSPASWSAFDLTPLVPMNKPDASGPVVFGSAVVFDGEYIYLASDDAPIIMRFDARTPPKMPKGFSGAFY